jgi:hypothetical protein
MLSTSDIIGIILIWAAPYIGIAIMLVFIAALIKWVPR